MINLRNVKKNSKKAFTLIDNRCHCNYRSTDRNTCSNNDGICQ